MTLFIKISAVPLNIKYRQPQRQKMYSFVLCAKLNEKVAFHDLISFHWISCFTVVKFYEWALLIRYYTTSFWSFAMLLFAANRVFP